MKPGTELFDLIHSMSPAEKGYFRRYASRHVIGEQNEYLLLFEAVNRQSEYDEAAVRRRCAGAAFLRRLPATKHYLYALVLESMRAFHAGADAGRTVLELLADVEFLWEKGLYEQCRKRLAKARRLAERHELDTLLLHILDVEKRQRGYEADVPAHPLGDALFAQHGDVLRRIDNTARYKHLNYRLTRLIAVRGELGFDDAAVQAVVRDALLQSEQYALGSRSRLSLHQTLWLYHQFVTHDLEQCYLHNRRILELLDAHPDFTAERPSLLITAVCQYLTRCILLDRREEYLAHSVRLDELPRRLGRRVPERLRLDLIVEGCMVRMLYYMNFGGYEEGAAYIEAVGGEIRSALPRLDPDARTALCFNSAVLCFHGGRHVQALEWLNDVLHADYAVREDALGTARLLSLLVHVELGNEELLAYAVRSVYRYLAQREQIGPAEQTVLRFLRKLPDAITTARQIEQLVQLRSDLCALQDDALLSLAVARFDILGWLDQRIALLRSVQTGASGGNRRPVHTTAEE